MKTTRINGEEYKLSSNDDFYIGHAFAYGVGIVTGFFIGYLFASFVSLF